MYAAMFVSTHFVSTITYTEPTLWRTLTLNAETVQTAVVNTCFRTLKDINEY